MALMQPPVCDFDTPAIDFNLPGTDGQLWSLEKCRGENGTLIMFICNHCPYVKAIQDKLVEDALKLQEVGVNSVAIMSNDTASFPDDSFENMQKISEQFNYPFPYLLDESQEIARAYGAVCTPDFFGYNRDMKLQYRGRLDDTTPSNSTPDARRDLVEAMQMIADTGKGPEEQTASMGCSIKWRA
ncbi:MAG: thioredoxin family protein [Gammaproteobacteria bacterium]|nr:thioredoxin family protein [Gammaproteobacteria bacterium]